MSRLLYIVVFSVCWLVGLLPLWFLYGVLARFVAFVLYRVVRYRLGVVRSNLESSFPDRSRDELRAIERRFYTNLAEYFVDAVDLASISRRQLMKRCDWPEENRRALNRIAGSRNWVTLLGHYGSWEMLSTFGLWPDSAAMVSLYKPLKGKVFDMYYRRIRNRFAPAINSIPNTELIRYYLANKDGLQGRPLSVALISDQNAPLDAFSEWVPFLNHPTVFFHGGEKIARKFSLPIFYMHVRKVRRGHWEQTFELIWDGVSPTEDHLITRRYGEMLEAEICRVPELWLWSHKRWKKKLTGDDLAAFNRKYGL